MTVRVTRERPRGRSSVAPCTYGAHSTLDVPVSHSSSTDQPAGRRTHVNTTHGRYRFTRAPPSSSIAAVTRRVRESTFAVAPIAERADNTISGSPAAVSPRDVKMNEQPSISADSIACRSIKSRLESSATLSMSSSRDVRSRVEYPSGT